MNLTLVANSDSGFFLMGPLVMLVALAIGIAFIAFWIWMLVDCIKNEPDQGNDKVVWVIVIALLGWLGALIYLLARRPARIRQYGK